MARPLRPLLKRLGYEPADGSVADFLHDKAAFLCTVCENWCSDGERADDGSCCHWCRWNLTAPWEVAQDREAA